MRRQWLGIARGNRGRVERHHAKDDRTVPIGSFSARRAKTRAFGCVRLLLARHRKVMLKRSRSNATRLRDGSIRAECDGTKYRVFTFYDAKAGKMHEVAADLPLQNNCSALTASDGNGGTHRELGRGDIFRVRVLGAGLAIRRNVPALAMEAHHSLLCRYRRGAGTWLLGVVVGR